MPLHDPVRLAEQLAVAQLVSGGRVSVVAGLGYRHEEFEMAGVDRRQRGKLLEEYVGVMRQAWTGEPFEWRGRDGARDAGARVAADDADRRLDREGGAARRAAARRLLPGHRRPRAAAASTTRSARRRASRGFVGHAGRAGLRARHRGPRARLGAHRAARPLRRADLRRLADAGPALPGARRRETADELRRSGVYRVVTPDECVALAQEIGRVILHPLMGGLPPALGWESLELFEQKVLPRLRGD